MRPNTNVWKRLRYRHLVGNTSNSPVVTAFLLANTHELTHLAPESNRLVNECGFVRIDGGTFPDKIDFVDTHDLGLLDEFPEEVEAWVNDNDGVVLEEFGSTPFGSEGAVAVEDDHRAVPTDTPNGAVWLEPTYVWLRVVC